MKTLFDGIYAAYSASTLQPMIELYNTEADDEATYPYGVFQLVSGIADAHASNKHHSENMLIQFNLFDRETDETALLVIYEALKLCYDFTVLTVGGYTHLSCVREQTLQTRVDKVWQINVTYRMKIRK